MRRHARLNRITLALRQPMRSPSDATLERRY
jgi:hypothetical protein